MIKHKLILSAITLATLSGCTTDSHIKVGERCITCWNSPISGDAYGHDQGTSAERQARIDEDAVDGGRRLSGIFEIDKEVNEDVDVLFIRFSRAWNIRSPADIQAEEGVVAAEIATQMDKGYKWEALPGVSYDMRNHINGNGHTVWYFLNLEKAGQDKTFVNIRYNVEGNVVNPQQVMAGYLKKVGVIDL